MGGDAGSSICVDAIINFLKENLASASKKVKLEEEKKKRH